MFNGLRQSMAWLHTWSGLIVSWLLYFIFVTGTLGYFDNAIDRWMKPEIPYQPALTPYPHAIDAAQSFLNETAADAQTWTLVLPEQRNPYLTVEWSGADIGEATFDLGGNRIEHRRTGGGQWLYELHFRLHYLPIKLAYWIVCICTMVMLAALITGVIIHKKILIDFFTFRPGKKSRSWLDLHNLLSVSALPFHLMITYSGLLFLASTFVPDVFSAAYGGGKQTAYEHFSDEFFGPSHRPASGTAVSSVNINQLLRDAAGEWGEHAVRLVTVYHPNDGSSTTRLIRMIGANVARSERLYYNTATGERIDYVPVDGPGKTTRMAMVNLHEGLFASPLLRWLYFISGLAGSGMIATGLILWVNMREEKKQRTATEIRSHRFVENANIGVLLGLPIAISLYFWLNRILPAGWEHRVALEQNGFFLTLLACVVYSLLVPAAVAWRHLLIAISGLFGLLPLASECFGGSGLVSAILRGDLTMVTFNLVLWATSLCSVMGLRKLPASTERPKVETS